MTPAFHLHGMISVSDLEGNNDREISSDATLTFSGRAT